MLRSHDHNQNYIVLFRLLLLLPCVLACHRISHNPTDTPTATPKLTGIVPPTPLPKVTRTPQPTNTPTPDVVYHGISFSYPQILASDVKAEVIPASKNLEENLGLPYPEHVQFTFSDYVLPNASHKPQIIIYPVSDFKATNEYAEGVIANLQQFLTDKPTVVSGQIPFFPFFNAAQLFKVHIGYLDFQNGAGVRFLTQYGQSATPIDNKGLFYTFQGLTHDGSAYVAAILPVSHPMLPADGADTWGDDYEAFANNFADYLRDVEQTLSAQAASSFTPSLSSLDRMIQSLEVK
jgi:hypothetical protein